MKLFNMKSFLIFGIVVLTFTSCKVTTTTKNIKYLPVEFEGLARNQYTILSDLTAEATITKSRGKLDRQYAKNYKRGECNDLVTVSIGQRQPTFFEKLFSKNKGMRSMIIRDNAAEFAIYALIEKYPDIDYFVNLRYDRVVEKRGGSTKETLKIKADGIELKTDK